MEATNQSLTTPIKLGIIIGLVYSLLIFLQNQFFYSNPLTFSIIKFLCYLIILTGYFYTGLISRKELGGYISFKECLRSILIVILITEIFYLLFSIIYVKYIEPTFFEKLKTAWINYFTVNHVPQEKINDTIQNFNEAGKITIGSLFQSLGFSIIIDAIFGIIIATILKKSKPIFDSQA